MKDPYEVLGVGRDASQEDIKRAYRKLAREHHPDVNPGIDDSKFKEIQAAYEVLGDAEKRQQFDRFGQTGNPADFWANRNNPFSSVFDDFVQSFFTTDRPVKGEPVSVAVPITLQEVVSGCDREVLYPAYEMCQSCNGQGGTMAKCTHCEGAGHRIIRGKAMTVKTSCEACRGTGMVMGSMCTNCDHGYTGPISKKVSFRVPPGVENGMRFAFRGLGKPSPTGGVPGDLFLVIEVKEHETIRRLANGDVISVLPVTYTELVLGAKKTVQTLHGECEIILTERTQIRHKFRLKDKGLPRFSNGHVIYNKGDHYVELELQLPTEITPEYANTLTRLSELEGR